MQEFNGVLHAKNMLCTELSHERFTDLHDQVLDLAGKLADHERELLSEMAKFMLNGRSLACVVETERDLNDAIKFAGYNFSSNSKNEEA